MSISDPSDIGLFRKDTTFEQMKLSRIFPSHTDEHIAKLFVARGLSESKASCEKQDRIFINACAHKKASGYLAKDRDDSGAYSSQNTVIVNFKLN